MWNKLLERIIDKLLSGKFILTVLVGYTLCRMALEKMISPAEFLTIAGVVVYAYFTKGGKNGKSTPEIKG